MGFAQAFGTAPSTAAPAAPSPTPAATPKGFAAAFGQTSTPNVALQRQTTAKAAAPTPAPNGVAAFVAPLFGKAVDAAKGIIGGAKEVAKDVTPALTAPLDPSSYNFKTASQTNPMTAVHAGWDTVTSAIQEAGSRASDAYLSIANPKVSATKNYNDVSNPGITKTDKGVAVGNAGLGVINAVLSPISGALKALAKVPVVGVAAGALNNVFGVIGAASGDTGEGAVAAIPSAVMSDATKAKITPLVKEASALIGQILAGKVGADVAGAPKQVEQLKNTLSQIIDHAKVDPAVSPEAVAHALPVTKAPDTIFNKAATPEIKGNINSAKATDMHPDLRAEVRASLEKNGVPATHQALMNELAAGARQSESLIREAPTPQNEGEELQAHQSALRSAVGEKNLTPDKMGVIPMGAKGKPSIDTIDADTGKVTKGVAPKDGFAPQTTPKAPIVAVKEAEVVPEPSEVTPKEPQVTSEPRPAETPPTPEAKALKTEPGVSKIGKSIEAKAVEGKLTKGFKDTAHYDTITIKDQAARATKLVNENLDDARAAVRGDKPLPEGLRGTALITAMEEHIKANPNPELAEELANSPLVSQTSGAAQEMRLAAERTPDSATARLQEIKDSLIKRAGGSDKVARAKTALIKGARTAMKVTEISKEDASWDNFLNKIEC